ncbi:thioredoxin-dependent thiol peroxidase [Methanoplanus sp. FWC-SCC4]|uniref:thioredoxin-dependent peroxiredoxin n=1 Tax=Methanochimaera problematica TaxID=2609417 RepID=A0AA97FBV5_9EURY|nr:thioredoxin-dependent thiol peroxidase [Methanoplanus sp. FWC-SCC4]WOF16089.1 thioredoxin-dependent thiol peroxidase [Methanoplanus sp. FWC-SCC4]
MDEIKTGDMAPEFSIRDSNEKETCLSVFKGTKIILYFYPKDNTPGCTLEAVSFTEKLKEFEDLDAIVIGISPDSCESHRKFSRKHNIGFILLSNPEHDVLKSYNVWKPKKMFGKEFLGVERSTFLIDENGIIKKIWRKVKVKGHAEEVLKELKS